MKSTLKYEEIAKLIEDQILLGNLKPGQRLPSIREMRRERNVSPSTVFTAYYSLEARGLIEARDRSGYYVSLHPVQQQKLKQANSTASLPSPASTTQKHIQEIILEVQQTTLDSTYLVPATASPSIKTLPVEKLNKSVKEALMKQRGRLLQYEDAQGSTELRKHILVQCMKWGGNYKLEDVVITAGCLEAVNLCLNVLLKEGDTLLADPLNYFNISEIIVESRFCVHGFSFAEAPFDATTFEQVLIEKKIKACLISANFHNPTGSSLSEEEKKSIVAIAQRNRVFIIEDDIFGELYWGKSRPGTLKKWDDDGIVYYCSSFSKTLMPGYRIGYCIPGSGQKELIRHKRLLSLGTNSLAQAALVQFMETGRYDLHIKKLRKQLHLNLLQYGECILRYFPKEASFQVPAGGYVLWIGFPAHFDSYELFVQAKEAKIVLVPGQVFSLAGTHQNYIRLSFAEPFSEGIEQGLKKAGALAQELLARSKSHYSIDNH